jgi:hypothetical protein
LNKIQERVGILFSILSLVLLISKLIYSIINNNLNTFVIEDFPFILYIIIFGITIFWKNKITRIVQIIVTFLTSLIALYSSIDSPFFGLVMLIFSILLYWCYGFFQNNKLIKSIIFGALLYPFFTFIYLYDDPKKYLRSFQWWLFIIVFLFLLWIIFQEQINKEEKNNMLLVKKYEEKMEVLQEQLEASIKAGIDLLDIIKSSDKHKGDDCE